MRKVILTLLAILALQGQAWGETADSVTQQIVLPPGSVLHAVEANQGWETLAKIYGVDTRALQQTNRDQPLRVDGLVVIPAPRGGWPVHSVQRGETLWRIGKGYGISVAQLRQANQLDSDEILQGQRLLLPRAEKPVWTASPPPLGTQNLTGFEKEKVQLGSSGPSVRDQRNGPQATINPEGGWVEVRLADDRRAWAPMSALVIGSWQPQPPHRVLEVAKRFLGLPYRWGGGDPNGWDCSGFVHEVFRLNGHVIPRMADHQFEAAVPVETGEMEPGDLLFFNTDGSGISHVGIYVGEGSFIHASSSRGVVFSSLRESYYEKCFLGAARITAWMTSDEVTTAVK